MDVWLPLSLREGFSIEPYDQEIERCGGSRAITAAEDVFAADSRTLAAQTSYTGPVSNWT